MEYSHPCAEALAPNNRAKANTKYLVFFILTGIWATPRDITINHMGIMNKIIITIITKCITKDTATVIRHRQIVVIRV